MSQNKDNSGLTTRTVLRVSCRACEEVDTTTQLEHGPDDPQTRIVEDAHHTMADEHADETGHHVAVNKEVKDAN